MKKILNCTTALLLALCLTLAAAVPAQASDLLQVKATKVTKDDGTYTMKIDIKNDWVQKGTATAVVYNPAGKQILKWKPDSLKPPQSSFTYKYGVDLRDYPSGKYTFRMNFQGQSAQWSQSFILNHKRNSSISFKNYETYYDTKGRRIHKFNIQCTNIKGETLSAKLYDSKGNFLYEWDKSKGKPRKTSNEVGFFGWSGYVNGKRYPSGTYTLVVRSTNGLSIEKDFKLNIFEEGKG